MHMEEVLVKPLLTEKSSVVTDENNRYVGGVSSLGGGR